MRTWVEESESESREGEWKSRGFGGSEGVQMDKLAPVTTQR